MSKILSDEDGDTIWNDPTPNIDDEIDKLMRIAEQEEGISGYGVTPAFVRAVKQLITDARVDELEKIMQGEKTIQQFVGGGREPHDIVTYIFSEAEIKDRIKELKENKR